jgi:hypothetical protein
MAFSLLVGLTAAVGKSVRCRRGGAHAEDERHHREPTAHLDFHWL